MLKTYTFQYITASFELADHEENQNRLEIHLFITGQEMMVTLLHFVML